MSNAKPIVRSFFYRVSAKLSVCHDTHRCIPEEVVDQRKSHCIQDSSNDEAVK